MGRVGVSDLSKCGARFINLPFHSSKVLGRAVPLLTPQHCQLAESQSHRPASAFPAQRTHAPIFTGRIEGSMAAQATLAGLLSARSTVPCTASTSGRPWAAAPLRLAAATAGGRRAPAAAVVAAVRRRMSTAVQAVAAEPQVAANGAPGECKLACTY